MSPLFANYKAKRIEHILSAPPSILLSKPWVKRALSVIAVVSSYLALAALIIAPPLADKDHYAADYLPLLILANYLPWIMLISFLLLRRSTRRITSLPDEYLDEREIADRDWAFRMGYVVIRRVGLAITALVLAGVVFQYLFPYTTWGWSSTAEPSFISKATLAVNEFLIDSFAHAPIYVLSGYIVLLTYVAYSFPVILLAWRDAASARSLEQPVDDSETWAATILYYAKSYKKRIVWVLGVLGYVVLLLVLQPLLWIVQATPITVFLMLGYIIVIPASFYALYVYFWALVAQTRIVKLLAKPGLPEQASFARSTQLVLLIIASLVGVLVPATWWVGVSFASMTWGLGIFLLVLAEGATLIVVQVSAFRLAKKVALGAK